MFESGFDYPQESGPCAYFDREKNIWINDEGQPLLDLREMGFTALQRETILAYIHQNPEAHYICVLNNRGEAVELFWDDKEVSSCLQC